MNESKIFIQNSYKDDVLVTNNISFLDEKLQEEYHHYQNVNRYTSSLYKDGINSILDDNNDAFIIQVLNQIDPAINDWTIGMGDTIRVELNSEKRRLLNLMGDGTRKVFALL